MILRLGDFLTLLLDNEYCKVNGYSMLNNITATEEKSETMV